MPDLFASYGLAEDTINAASKRGRTRGR